MTPPVARSVQALPVAAICDALVQLDLRTRVTPPGLRPIQSGPVTAGPVRPVRHAGSTDLLLEAIEIASPGEVLVIDNGGRTDEACVGDLIALEARDAGLAAIVIWGLHRDTTELRGVGLPIFSYGHLPVGPTAARPRAGAALDSARFADHVVTTSDVIAADDDGAVFVAADDVEAVWNTASGIVEAERRQADLAGGGTTLREQLAFAAYLSRRVDDPTYDFRRHLRERGGAIER